MTKKSATLLAASLLLLLAGAATLWWSRDTPAPASAARPAPKTGIVATAHNSHPFADSYSKTGDIRTLPAIPALEEALSHASRLPFDLRLKAVHKLQGVTLTTAQTDYLRAFVADPVLPEGLDIRQIRALKNDVLNILCVQPGEEAVTAKMLRALHADENADPGLRDYALQHLVTLIERDPGIGWATHWQALEGPNTDLAATALLHLSIHLRSQVSSFTSQPSVHPQVSLDERQRIAAAALRLAADTTAKDPVRTTAIQVCGQLKLTEARSLAAELARSDQESIPLRIAAVATLGDLGGDAATRDYLTALMTGPEKRLRVPAESALKRISIKTD